MEAFEVRCGLQEPLLLLLPVQHESRVKGAPLHMFPTTVFVCIQENYGLSCLNLQDNQVLSFSCFC